MLKFTLKLSPSSSQSSLEICLHLFSLEISGGNCFLMSLFSGFSCCFLSNLLLISGLFKLFYIFLLSFLESISSCLCFSLCQCKFFVSLFLCCISSILESLCLSFGGSFIGSKLISIALCKFSSSFISKSLFGKSFLFIFNLLFLIPSILHLKLCFSLSFLGSFDFFLTLSKLLSFLCGQDIMLSLLKGKSILLFLLSNFSFFCFLGQLIIVGNLLCLNSS